MTSSSDRAHTSSVVFAETQESLGTGGGRCLGEALPDSVVQFCPEVPRAEHTMDDHPLTHMYAPPLFPQWYLGSLVAGL